MILKDYKKNKELNYWYVLDKKEDLCPYCANLRSKGVNDNINLYCSVFRYEGETEKVHVKQCAHFSSKFLDYHVPLGIVVFLVAAFIFYIGFLSGSRW